MGQFPYSWNLYRRWSLDIEFPPGNTAMSIETFPLCHGKHEDFQADFGLMNLMFQPAPVSPVVVYNVNMYAAIWEIHFNDILPTYYHSSGLLHLQRNSEPVFEHFPRSSRGKTQAFPLNRLISLDCTDGQCASKRRANED